jgi:hypothetical protein
MKNSKYVDAALAVFQELGVKEMSTRDLVRAAQERKLVDEAKWTYHNMSRKVRDSELFDTADRGMVRLLDENEVEQGAIEVSEAVPGTDPILEEESVPGTGPIVSYPGPVIGSALGAEDPNDFEASA